MEAPLPYRSGGYRQSSRTVTLAGQNRPTVSLAPALAKLQVRESLGKSAQSTAYVARFARRASEAEGAGRESRPGRRPGSESETFWPIFGNDISGEPGRISVLVLLVLLRQYHSGPPEWPGRRRWMSPGFIQCCSGVQHAKRSRH